MAVRRHLTDLYQTGRELEFREGEQPVLDSDTGEPVLDEFGEPKTEPVFVEKVWVAKLQLADHKAAVRRADAAKAQVLIGARNRDGEEWTAALGMVDELCGDDRNLMIDFVVADELAQRQEAIGAEVEGEEVDGEDGPEPSEWKKDNYLQGLYDAWNGADGDEADSMKVRYAQNPEDPEAKRIFDEMARFISVVDERMKEERLRLAAEIGELDDDSLRWKIAELHMESRSNQAWFDEFNRARTFLALRKADKHTAYYLQSIDHVDQLHPTISEAVIAAVEEMAIDVTEGKGSPATRISSR